MYSVLNKLSQYTWFLISNNITSYIFCLLLKSLKPFIVSLNHDIPRKIVKIITLSLERELQHSSNRNRNSYNDGVQRNPRQLPQRDNKVSKTKEQK